MSREICCIGAERNIQLEPGNRMGQNTHIVHSLQLEMLLRSPFCGHDACANSQFFVILDLLLFLKIDILLLAKIFVMSDPKVDEAIAGLANLTLELNNAVLHSDAQTFFKENNIVLEYENIDGVGMASTIRGESVGSRKILFVFLGPSDEAIKSREMTGDNVWHSFRAKQKWLRTIVKCDRFLQLTSYELENRFSETVSNLSQVYLMDLFPWKRWGNSRVVYSPQDETLALKWFKRQCKLIEPEIVVFFTKYGTTILEKFKRLTIGSLSLQFLVDEKETHYAVLPHPGALRVSSFEDVQDYLKTFIDMNFCLHNESPIPPVFYESAIDHYKTDDFIVNVLRSSHADTDFTFDDVKTLLSEHKITCPSQVTLRKIIKPFQLFDGDGDAILRGKAYLYRFPSVQGGIAFVEDDDDHCIEDAVKVEVSQSK
jgi:hypothetical protein